ncbi:MAG: HIT domain-containing protein [bacterium]
MPELRQNIITGDWVVIAPERAKRPHDFVIPKGIKVGHREDCPFCVESEKYKQNVLVHHDFGEHIYAMENKYPAFAKNLENIELRSFYPENGFYRAKPSIGDHEIIVIKEHELSLPTFTLAIMNEMFEAIRERYLYFKKKGKSICIVPIYNHGAESGASIDHPHAQIFASDVIFNSVGREINGADRYYGINGACVYCDIIKHESEQKIRVVYENDLFIAINFFASRFPFETWIMPKRHESQFELTSKKSMEQFSRAVVAVEAMLNQTLDNPPLNFYIHTLPTIHENSETYHWHLEINPRVSYYGGFELGTDIIINVMAPEEAAHYLKSKK